VYSYRKTLILIQHFSDFLRRSHGQNCIQATRPVAAALVVTYCRIDCHMAAFLETAQFLPKAILAYFNTFSASFWSAKISVTECLFGRKMFKF